MNEAQFLRILDYQDDLICFYQPGGTLTFANQAYARFLGRPSEELIGTKFILPEDERSAVDRHLTSQKQPDRHLTLELEISNSVGTPRWIHWTQRAIFDEWGQVSDFIAIGRDITERKLAEIELNEYLDRLDILHRVDRELTRRLNMKHVLVMALDVCIRMSGAIAGFIALMDNDDIYIAEEVGGYPPGLGVPYLEPSRGIVGRVMHRLKPELVSDMNPATEVFSVVPKTRAQMAFPLVSQDRLVGILCLETSAPELFTQSIFQFVTLITRRIAVALDNAQLYDMTQRQLHELQELYEKVSRLEQIKTDMIRIAAHDLRNPIGIIMGYVGALKMRIGNTLSDQDKEFMDRIRRAAERMERITKDILSLQRIEQSAKNELRQRIHLNDLVEQVFEEHSEQAQFKNLRYTRSIIDDPVYISGDPAELTEALSNLLSNAIKYTPERGSIVVRLQTHNSIAAFKVEDNGYGIPDDMQAQLFQPFYRAKTAETENIEGTGLGLHLVKSIIERHGGSILFHSVLGQGSTFGFEVPLTK